MRDCPSSRMKRHTVCSAQESADPPSAVMCRRESADRDQVNSVCSKLNIKLAMRAPPSDRETEYSNIHSERREDLSPRGPLIRVPAVSRRRGRLGPVGRRRNRNDEASGDTENETNLSNLLK